MRLIFACVAAATFAIVNVGAKAQDFPSRPLTVIVPSGAGSYADTTARVLAQSLTGRVGQPIIVVNEPGVVGIAKLSRAQPDGYTLLLTSRNMLGWLEKQVQPLSFRLQDLVGIASVGSVPLVLVVSQNRTPVPRSVDDLIRSAKQRPDTLTFATAGLASAESDATALLQEVGTVKVTTVPFRSSSEGLSAVVQGHVDAGFFPIPLAEEHIKQGRVTAIATSAGKRLPQLPNVATFREAGADWQRFSYEIQYFLYAPNGTPAAARSRLEKEVSTVFQVPDFRNTLLQRGWSPTQVPNTCSTCTGGCSSCPQCCP